jgi:hypothetical protein
MRVRPVLTVTICAALAGCGDASSSNLNPFNWFGGGSETVAAVAPDGAPVDPRPLIAQVTAAVAERVPGGVIVRATGVPPTMGYWSADLVPVDRDLRPDENGVLTLEFRAFPPVTAQPAGSPAARQIVAGFFLSDQTLEGVRSVAVRGETNTRSLRP